MSKVRTSNRQTNAPRPYGTPHAPFPTHSQPKVRSTRAHSGTADFRCRDDFLPIPGFVRTIQPVSALLSGNTGGDDALRVLSLQSSTHEQCR